MSRTLRAIIFFFSFAIGFGSAAAWAGLAQDGHESNSHKVDGGSGNIRGDSFNPGQVQCVIYSVLTRDFTGSSRQIETGIDRCGSGAQVGACPSGDAFVERYDGSNYDCNAGNSFSNGTAYYASSFRNTSTSTTVTGSINGAANSVSGFGLSDSIVTEAWGEITGGTSCPNNPASAHFSYWSRYVYGSGWLIIDDASNIHAGSLSPCFSVSPVGSMGGFDVN